jgi:hypothetical protein
VSDKPALIRLVDLMKPISAKAVSRSACVAQTASIRLPNSFTQSMRPRSLSRCCEIDALVEQRSQLLRHWQR